MLYQYFLVSFLVVSQHPKIFAYYLLIFFGFCFEVCARRTTLNAVIWYSRTDAALVGSRNQHIDIRYGLTHADLRNGRRITGGSLCGTIYIRGWDKGESAITNCRGAPIALPDGHATFITLQKINAYKNFLMVGEVVIQ